MSGIPYRGHHRTRAQSGRVCTKRCYPTAADAAEELDRIRAQARANRDRTSRRQERRVQWCPAHSCYHLTKKRARRT